MEKRRLGKSDIYVSSMGLGCMSLPKTNEGTKIIEHALLEGVNFFDTADLYDFGVNEEIVGKALKGNRNDVIIATKVGNRWEPGQDGWKWDPSKAYIKDALKQSLKRLQTDYIDLYQLHGGTLEDPIDEIIEAFEDLKTEGYIREYGISSIRPNVIKEYVTKSNITSVMMQYSLLDRRPEENILDLLKMNEVSVIGRGPLAKGLLTKHWHNVLKTKFIHKNYLDYSTKELEELLERLADQTDGQLESVAFAYPLSHPAVATIIPGTSTISQLTHNINAFNSKVVTLEQLASVRSLTRNNVYEAHRI